jgi:hypothetical protein
MLDDRLLDRHGIVRVEPAVAVVGHGEVVERIEAPRIRMQLRQLHARRAHRRGAETRTGAERGGQIERHAGDHDVDAIEFAGVFAAHERQDTRVGVFDRRAIKRRTTDRAVAVNEFSHG